MQASGAPGRQLLDNPYQDRNVLYLPEKDFFLVYANGCNDAWVVGE